MLFRSVMPQVAIAVGVTIGCGCIINTGAVVEHDCGIGDGVHLCPGTTLGGTVVIGDRSWICLGSFFDINEDKTLSTSKKILNFYGSGEHPHRQKQPYLHSVVFSPDKSVMLAADLGRDYIYQLSNDVDGYLSVNDSLQLEPGSGPHHLVFSNNGDNVYVICALLGQVATLFKTEETYEVVHYIVADKVRGESSADIHLSGDGRFLYASVRDAQDGIAIYNVDTPDGIPESIGYLVTYLMLIFRLF